jgi:hypothetical protein
LSKAGYIFRTIHLNRVARPGEKVFFEDPRAGEQIGPEPLYALLEINLK